MKDVLKPYLLKPNVMPQKSKTVHANFFRDPMSFYCVA